MVVVRAKKAVRRLHERQRPRSSAAPSGEAVMMAVTAHVVAVAMTAVKMAAATKHAAAMATATAATMAVMAVVVV